MIAVDTSVVVPALVSWHEAHEVCRPMAAEASIPAHAVVEAYAVLTRLPPPHRVEAMLARRLLETWFPAGRVLVPTPSLLRSAVARLADRGVGGGASYDGLVGLTAADRGADLVTRDARARSTYERLGVRFRLVAGS